MPTFIDGTDLKHICIYCLSLHTFQHCDIDAARFRQYRCDECRETFTDFNPYTQDEWKDFLAGKLPG